MRAIHLLSILCLPLATLAQTYPTKPIRVVVSVPPGGTDDFMGRLVAQGLTDAFGRPSMVENRPGGGGLVGREFVARAAPDGYTLLLAGGSLAAIPALRPNIKLDVVRDYTPISSLADVPHVLLVHPNVPAKSVRELVTLAMANPGKLTHGSTGIGLTPHLVSELFKLSAKVNIHHVPYQGGAAMYIDLISGRVDMGFSLIASALPHLAAGKMRALGVASDKRSSVLPDVPTFAESGIQNSELPASYAMFGPAGITRDVVTTLNSAIQKYIGLPETRKRLVSVALEPQTSTPEQLAEQLKHRIALFDRIIREAGIKVE